VPQCELVTALSIWVWEVRGQNAQVTTATPQANGKWECQRFDFVRREPDLGNSTGDLEAFLQTARRVQLVSSGLPGLGSPPLYESHYDVIACRQPYPPFWVSRMESLPGFFAGYFSFNLVLSLFLLPFISDRRVPVPVINRQML